MTEPLQISFMREVEDLIDKYFDHTELTNIDVVGALTFISHNLTSIAIDDAKDGEFDIDIEIDTDEEEEDGEDELI